MSFLQRQIHNVQYKYHMTKAKINGFTKGDVQGLTLRHARMPGACKSCPRAHKLLWLRVRQGKWCFNLAGLFFPSSIHKLYRACTNIGWAGEHFCRAHKFSEPHARCKLMSDEITKYKRYFMDTKSKFTGKEADSIRHLRSYCNWRPLILALSSTTDWLTWSQHCFR